MSSSIRNRISCAVDTLVDLCEWWVFITFVSFVLHLCGIDVL